MMMTESVMMVMVSVPVAVAEHSVTEAVSTESVPVAVAVTVTVVSEMLAGRFQVVGGGHWNQRPGSWNNGLHLQHWNTQRAVHPHSGQQQQSENLKVKSFKIQ
jgi:hypothetical protein